MFQGVQFRLLRPVAQGRARRGLTRSSHSLRDPTSIHSAFSFFVSPLRQSGTDLAVGQGGLSPPITANPLEPQSPFKNFCYGSFEEERLEFEDNDFSPPHPGSVTAAEQRASGVP